MDNIKDVKTALLCCGNTDTKRPDCERCPLNGYMCVKRMLEGAVKFLEAQAAEIERLTRERDKAIADIPHKCWSCANGFYTENGFDCDQTHYKGRNPDCLSWVWRGQKEE